MNAAVSVVGVGADGCASLTSRAHNAIVQADVLVGGARLLELFPDHHGERITLAGGLQATLDTVARAAEDRTVCVLASGDPLLFGIGAHVARVVGAEHVRFIPQPSAAQWAFARAGLAWNDATIVSVHGRKSGVAGFCARLRSVHKAAVFTDAESSPPRLAAHLLEHGSTNWRGWLCENLCGPDERVRALTLPELAQLDDVEPLNTLLLVRSDSDWRPPAIMPYRHEDAFAKRMPKRGLITKREVRTLAVAALGVRADSIVWDVGAGSGSVAIDVSALASRGEVFAIETDPEGVRLCQQNVRTHGADNVRVIHGMAPDALADLPRPDAVFIGGSKGRLASIVDAATATMDAGKIVVTAVTLDSVADALAVLRRPGLVVEVSLLQISRGVPLARYLRYEAMNPIHMFVAEVSR